MAQRAPQTITLAAGMQRSYDGVKRNLTEMAEKMAEADYTFQITKDVRTFGQLFGHVANSQFGACSAARGVANPNQGNDNEKKTTKAEFVKALADSFAFCDEAFKMLTDANATEMVKQGQNSVARGAILANVIAHNNEMYGTAIAVHAARKGLVPPSTERMQQMTRKPGATGVRVRARSPTAGLRPAVGTYAPRRGAAVDFRTMRISTPRPCRLAALASLVVALPVASSAVPARAARPRPRRAVRGHARAAQRDHRRGRRRGRPRHAHLGRRRADGRARARCAPASPRSCRAAATRWPSRLRRLVLAERQRRDDRHAPGSRSPASSRAR